MSAEEWRPIPGWEDRYEVSDQGRLRSLRRADASGEPLLVAPQSNVKRGGYLQVRLYVGRKGRRAYMHRLVLEAFVGPRPQGLVTRHLNGDPTDNRLSNLQYGTQADNMADRHAHGTHPSLLPSCRRGHEYTPENTIRRPSSKGRRLCRECERAKEERRATRRRAAA